MTSSNRACNFVKLTEFYEFIDAMSKTSEQGVCMTFGNEAPQEKPESEETGQIETKCPRCGSTNWHCWDERVETHRDKATGQEYEFPVGYMKCLDCGKTYLDDPYPDENIQDEIDYYNGD